MVSLRDALNRYIIVARMIVHPMFRVSSCHRAGIILRGKIPAFSMSRNAKTRLILQERRAMQQSTSITDRHQLSDSSIAYSCNSCHL